MTCLNMIGHLKENHNLHVNIIIFKLWPKKIYILYINSVSLSVCLSVEVLKLKSLLIKLSLWIQGFKNYLGSQVLTSYFYFYIRFRAAIAVVNRRDIFGIWRVGEEIWVHFFGAKGLEGSWLLFFSWRGEGVGF